MSNALQQCSHTVNGLFLTFVPISIELIQLWHHYASLAGFLMYYLFTLCSVNSYFGIIHNSTLPIPRFLC